MTTRHHMCLSVRGAIRSRDPGGFRHDDGRAMTWDEVLEYLCDELKKGHEVIPFGECDNFDFSGGGCQGHPVTEDQA